MQRMALMGHPEPKVKDLMYETHKILRLHLRMTTICHPEPKVKDLMNDKHETSWILRLHFRMTVMMDKILR